MSFYILKKEKKISLFCLRTLPVTSNEIRNNQWCRSKCRNSFFLLTFETFELFGSKSWCQDPNVLGFEPCVSQSRLNKESIEDCEVGKAMRHKCSINCNQSLVIRNWFDDGPRVALESHKSVFFFFFFPFYCFIVLATTSNQRHLIDLWN